jgi:hypothetical protein
MSAILFDHLRLDAQAPTTVPAKAGPKYRREEEFRAALDSYMASYRKHNATTADTGRGGPHKEGNK